MAARLRPLCLLPALGIASWALVFSAQQAFAQVAFSARRSHTMTLLADGNILVVGRISNEAAGGTYRGSAAGGVPSPSSCQISGAA